MVRRKSNSYRSEATKDLFELELTPVLGDNPDEGVTPLPTVVVFRSPQDLESETAFDMATMEDPREALQLLLADPEDPDDMSAWEAFWAEWAHKPMRDTNELLNDVMQHYSATPGKPYRSRR